MRMRRPRFFSLLVTISLFLCLVFGVMWIASRSITTAAVPSTYDVQVQLARKVPTIHLSTVALRDSVDFVADVGRSKVRVDWAALEAGGIGAESVITQNHNNIPLGEVLNSILTSSGPGAEMSSDAKGTRVTMKGVPWREPPAPPQRTYVNPNNPLPLSIPEPMGERVVGAHRYTLVMDRGLLRLWVTPIDPAAVYQQGGPRETSGSLRFMGVGVDRSGWPENTWKIEVPFWFLIALGALCPLLWLATAARRRRRRRREHRQCVHCGYDLRATPERCPECGRESASAEADPTGALA